LVVVEPIVPTRNGKAVVCGLSAVLNAINFVPIRHNVIVPVADRIPLVIIIKLLER